MLSRWLIAYLPPLFTVFAALAFAAHSYLGFLLILAVPALMLAGFTVATIGVFRRRCWHCNERFLSLAFPVCPFQSWCDHCSTRADESED
jgi:hypothetical protein